MDSKILEFLHKVSDKIEEIEDMVEDYGYKEKFLSCIVVGVISESDEHGSLLNSIYSMCIDSDEEMEKIEDFIKTTYSKLTKDKGDGMDSIFKDINLN